MFSESCLCTHMMMDTHTPSHTQMHARMLPHAVTNTCTLTQTHSHTQTHPHTRIQTHMQTHMHRQTCTHAHAHTRTCMHTQHTHAHTQHTHGLAHAQRQGPGARHSLVRPSHTSSSLMLQETGAPGHWVPCFGGSVPREQHRHEARATYSHAHPLTSVPLDAFARTPVQPHAACERTSL